MSSSNSNTRTNTSTWTSVKYLNDKIASDLDYIRTFHPNVYSAVNIEKWKQEFYSWMYEGYAKAIKLQFLQNGQCVCEISWEFRDDGSIAVDDNVGKLRIKGIEGTTPVARVEPTSKWNNLSTEEQQAFYQTLEGWGPGKDTKYAEGLNRVYDKQYSKGTFGIQRSVLGG
jgi:hypothetical protein